MHDQACTSAFGDHRTAVRRRVLRTAAFGGTAIAAVLALAQDADAAASVKARLRNDVVTVTGTANAEVISLRLRAGDPNILEIDVGANGSAEFNFDRRRFSAIVVDGLGGDDTLAVNHVNGGFTDTEKTQLNGGAGNDTILGGNGADRLDGGVGDDFVDGQQGADAVLLDDGADVFQWDAGDSSDVVEGGPGADAMVFNGNNAPEKFAATANGGRVSFTRDVATVTVDLDDVETIDLRAGGSSDTVNVNDLTGTDLTTVIGDLAAFGGGDDGAVDTVLARPGSRIGADGGAATIDGGGAQVRVVNGTPIDGIRVDSVGGADVATLAGTAGPDVISATANGLEVRVDGATPGIAVNLAGIETLDVDLGAGTDQFVSTGNVASLTRLDIDGGDDADVILGGNGADVLTGGAGDDFVDGQQGADVALLGDGADTVQWDPGDGNDVVEGGPGADGLVFNGSNAGEKFAVTANGGRVSFTRDVAAITLDLDDVETIDLRAGGSSDTINVNDLTGTDLTTVIGDLAAFGGGDDGAVDTVLARPGSRIGADGGAATIDGGGAQVRVVNGTPIDGIRVDSVGGADVATLAGTAGPDVISATANGLEVRVDGATPGIAVNLAGIETLDVDLGAGTDQFVSTGNVASLTRLDIDGGDDADVILGGNGADVLTGGAGDDFVDGQQGADVALLGDGADTVQWDPGDGNDVVEGGPGADGLVFNGSNAGEKFAVTANGGRVSFTRDVAAITLDLDDVETIDLRAGGSSDTITVNDLTGTDLTTVIGDLAAFGGGDDGAVDTVLARPGSRIGADGGAATIDGGGAQVRVVNGTPIDGIRVDSVGGADVATLAGTAGPDVISATANGLEVRVDGATPGIAVNLAGIETLDVDLGAGTDQFVSTGNVASLTRLDIDGGDDADVILGGNGADVLTGGAGDDFVDGQQGADVALLGDGADTVQWDPGDGNDVVEGGPGADGLVFNGSNAGEKFAVTANGGRVSFTRDVAAITLDLDDVETIDLHAGGSSDTITVNDLTGTDLTTVIGDLAALGGASSDGVVDQVIVNGTAGDDVIGVLDDGGLVGVDGLPTAVWISSADATLDQLTVNGLEGNDTVTPTPGAGNLILLTLVP